ncbi:phage portal protein [Gammaproteobacteria bacterium]|nr:phage portal protein [Gammaproteobacteria bacterium]
MFNKFKALFSKPQVSQQEKKSYRSNEVDRTYTTNAEWSDWDVDKAVVDGYKSSVPVFSCIKKRADSVASIPLVVEAKVGDEWEAVPNHPLQILLNSPNPDMSTAELMKYMVTHLDLAGNAFWMKVRGGAGGLPLELWPAKPNNITIYPGTDKLINKYLVGCLQKEVISEDMCHFMYVNPDSFICGQSPLQAAGKAVDVDNSAQSWQKISMQNRGVPDLHVSFDSALTQDQHESATDYVEDHMTGSGNARKPLVTSKATVKQMSMTPVEMDFMDTRRFSREEVCSVYGVPSALIAEMGAVNLANAETARKLFWLDTIIPLMDEIVDSMTQCLVSEYSEHIRITYDTSNVAALQENYSEKLDNAAKLWAMGYPTNVINQRLELGMDDIEGGDIGYIPTGVIPASYDFSAEPSEEIKKDVMERIIKAGKNG